MSRTPPPPGPRRPTEPLATSGPPEARPGTASGAVKLLLFAAAFLAPLAGIWIYAHYLDPGAAAPYDTGSAGPFDPDAWRRGERVARYQMASDLLDRYDFSGWTREQVEDLLGPAAPLAGGFRIDAGEDWGVDYQADRSFGLAFETDARGLVETVRFECEGDC